MLIIQTLFKIEENIEIWTIFAISSYKMVKLVSSWAHFKQNFKSFQPF